MTTPDKYFTGARMKITLSLKLSLALTVLAVATSATAATDCDGIKTLVLPDLRVESASRVETPAPHCKVAGIIGPEIRFELLLPESWNGKFLMGGGGGFVGSVQNSALAFSNPLQRGYATVGTDTGHQGNGVDASWALNNLERLVNFGHAAVHRTVEMSKAIAELHYGDAPSRSYFIGCSRGGGQALMAAQRYPQDFDGIIAGAPAFNWTGIAALGVQIQRKMYPDADDLSSAVVTRNNLELLGRSVLAACDGLDGLDDRVINDPRECGFDLADLPRCVEDVAAKDCFTEAQIAAVAVVYEGAFDTEGKRLAFGYPFGGEAEAQGWVPWIVGGPAPIAPGVPSLQFGFASGIMKYFVHQDANWQHTEQGFDDYAEITQLAASVLNATNPDLSAFKASGGKLLLWHGWADPALSALQTINYFESVQAADPAAEEHVRLFMLPGVLHCAGGTGPSFVDYLTALEDWVEQDSAPEQLAAFFNQAEVATGGAGRPLCAYPGKAQYTGGDARAQASFSCRD